MNKSRASFWHIFKKFPVFVNDPNQVEIVAKCTKIFKNSEQEVIDNFSILHVKDIYLYLIALFFELYGEKLGKTEWED